MNASHLRLRVHCEYLPAGCVGGILTELMYRWEWPPAVCGRHTDVVSLRLSKRWCMTSYRIFDKLRKILREDGSCGHGVRMRTANFFFDKPIEENAEEYEKMLEIEKAQVCLLVSCRSEKEFDVFDSVASRF